MITIIDYQVGNLGSIANMLKKIGTTCLVTSDPEKIRNAEKIILPGVGSFDTGINNLEKLGIREILINKANEGHVPFLGICLGMQLLTKGSEEGTCVGLGLVDAHTKKFVFETDHFKIPHMGWNFVKQNKKSRLFENMFDEPRFYFVHSYYVQLNNEEEVLTSTEYNISFTSSFEKDNIFGVQFHPEKSHKFGMTLLKNFAELQ